MEKKPVKSVSLMAVIWALIALVAVSAATYAWFSYSPYANITPMSGTVGGGEGDLLISNRSDGGFDRSCDLILTSSNPLLQPLSTADLRSFYTATAQSPSGISVAYAAADRLVDASSLHGTVYLLGEDAAYDVYFLRDGLSLGSDPQALAALRLGLRFTSGSETTTKIFRLDDMGNTADAVGRRTTPTLNTVVASVDASGSAVYRPDPAEQLSGYFAQQTGEQITPGQQALCRIPAGVVTSVEYWVYLEGCDENCINNVQGRDLALQMAFAGVPTT